MKASISGGVAAWMWLLASLGLALNHAAMAAAATVAVTDFVPATTPMAADLPRPDEFFGFAPGQRHLRHDQLLAYLRALAEASPRVNLHSIGATHEGRELVHLTITAADNHGHLETLRQQHLQGQGPLVVWLGYSIHGNEASGSNVAPWVAWYLAGSQESWVQDLLADSIILLDPSFNPDGMDRFATWSNGQAGLHPSADPNDWEHTEPWPNGRTNHYWFDLNRDWLPLVNPESRARVARFQAWRPHVLTDHHEMGSDSTFFFQPGVPSRTNPLTPQRNQELTAALGAFHARAFDAAGELFFTREIFDDYYYGKGSTYPDIQGSVGILFEQASVRGKRITTSYGERSLAASMLNHFRASVSTLQGADHHREDLFNWRREHDRQAQENSARGAWVLGFDNDTYRAADLIDVMQRHGIEVYELDEAVSSDDDRFTPGQAVVIPQRQRQALLIEAMFNRPRQFQDETFYDVSAFTLPLAYDLPYARFSQVPDLGERYTAPPAPQALSGEAPLAYAVPWHQLNAPGLLYALLQEQIRVRVATRPFTVSTLTGEQALTPGTLLIVPSIQDRPQALPALLTAARQRYPVTVHEITQGRALGGADLGSPRLAGARAMRPLLVVGAGLNPHDAGEIWHLLDQRVGLTPTRVEWYRLAYLSLEDYTHLLMVEGDYSQLPAAVLTRITDWVRRGGHLVLTKNASLWSETLPWAPDSDSAQAAAQSETSAAADAMPAERRPYAQFEDDLAKRIIGGAIMQLDVDTTHPLGYGLQRSALPVMKNNLLTLTAADTPYGTVAAYAETPLLAGYTSADNQKALAGKAAVTAQVYELGVVIRFADNPAFRGHWLGSSRMYLNSLFFSHLIAPTQLPPAPR